MLERKVGMIMKVNEIVLKVEQEFSSNYPQFKEFKGSNYWNKFIESILDRDFVVCVIFCNDIHKIPPTKTFLACYSDDLKQITADAHVEEDELRTIKRAIGAFWGMVFKFVLHYTEQKSVSVSMHEPFNVKTASLYSGVEKPFVIE
jgi:hypothetical protein